MNKNYQKITIAEIPNQLNFEGYYWYSDKQKPVILDNEKIDKKTFTALPFIIEGNFYAPKEQISIQVKNLNGTYHIAKIDLNLPEIILVEEKEYIAHDLKGIRKFKMKEAWQEVEDELLEGMSTLVPAWSAFSGFIKS